MLLHTTEGNIAGSTTNPSDIHIETPIFRNRQRPNPRRITSPRSKRTPTRFADFVMTRARRRKLIREGVEDPVH